LLAFRYCFFNNLQNYDPYFLGLQKYINFDMKSCVLFFGLRKNPILKLGAKNSVLMAKMAIENQWV